MLHGYWNRLAVIGGAAALLALGAAPAAAAGGSNPCSTGKVPYFASPNIYLGQEGTTNIWSSQVTVTAFCLRPGDPTDMSEPLVGVTVTGVAVTSTGAIPNLEASVDRSAPFQAVPTTFPGVKLPTPAGVITDSKGQATFPFLARSLTQPFLALPDGGTNFVGIDLDFGTGMSGIVGDPTPLGAGLVFAQTPELDSVFLFGSGAVGMAGYGLLRFRARRREERS